MWRSFSARVKFLRAFALRFQPAHGMGEFAFGTTSTFQTALLLLLILLGEIGGGQHVQNH
jgi:hypothetical protein